MKKWHSKSRKILSAITAAVVLFASCSGYFVKDVSVKADTLAKKSSNIHQHSYISHFQIGQTLFVLISLQRVEIY